MRGTIFVRVSKRSRLLSSRIRLYAILAAVGWTVVLAGLLGVNVAQVRHATRMMALELAEEGFAKDQAFRHWSAMHGGVYVPVTEETRPNPGLADLPDRDITRPDGTRLTLMNPAYMVRQLNEVFRGDFSVATHITSLKLLRPENAPDPWERAALEAFERGETHATSFTELDGEPHLRHMKAMLTQEGCLKCHEHQGYAVGDVRGGIAVTLPLAPFLAQERDMLVTLGVSYAAVWTLGLGAIALIGRRIERQAREREAAHQDLAEQKKLFQMVVDACHDPIVLKDRESRYQLVNPALCDFLGRSAESVIGHSDEDFFPPEEATAHRAEDQRVIAEGRTRVHDGAVTAGQGRRWLQVAKSPVRDSSGAITGVLCAVRDLTEIQAANAAIERRLEELERFEQITLSRELRLRELKAEVNALCQELERPAAYPPHDCTPALPDGSAQAKVTLPLEERVAALTSLAADALEERAAADRGRAAAEEARSKAEATLAELNASLEEKEKLYGSMLGREGRVLELKAEVNALCAELTRPPRYASVTEGGVTC